MTRIDITSLTRNRQAGGATVVVTLILFGIMTLIAAFANRNHVFEQRASANQYRSTKAFEAAEAGLEWAIAMLNNPRPLNDACEEGSGAAASFRERHLTTDIRSRLLTPIAASESGHASSLRAACVKQGDGWTCACPAGTSASLSAAGSDDRPAFVVEFKPEAQPGAIRIVATGCTSLAGECAPDSGKADATAHVQMTLGSLPALRTLPLAPLTAKDTVNAGTAALGLHNADASAGGITVHAGRSVLATNARWTTAPGAATDSAIVENDAALNAQPADRFFASFFGLGKTLWKQQPGVKPLRCGTDCTDALTAAIRAGHRMIWIDGDIDLAGTVSIGTRERPVAIVATGAARLAVPVQVHGVVYAASLSWRGAGGGLLRGAAISESTFDADSAADLVYDPTLLNTLASSAGSFARLPGSWKDF